MSYSGVTVDVPAAMLQASKFEQIPDTMRVRLLPMDGSAACGNVTDPALDRYKEMLRPYNMQMMQWLQDPENALMFATDPLKAFQTAVDAPEELVAELQKAKLTPQEGIGAKEDKEDVMSQIRQGVSRSLDGQIKDVTEGWDIVIGMRQNAVDKGLQYAYDKNLFPHTLAGECDSPLKGFDKIKVNAEVSAPSMEGGTGSNITVSIAATGGTLEFTGLKPIKADITGLKIELTLDLIQIKSPVQPQTGTRYDFMLDIASEKAFVGLALVNVPPVFQAFEILAEFALLGLLRETYAGKEYKIFSADLKGAGEFSFLIPEEIDYAGQSASGQLPAVGALVKTTGGHQGAVQLDTGLFPEGTEGVNAVMAMSRELFLKNTGSQGMVKAFQVDPSTFAYDTTRYRVYNTKEFNYFEKIKGYTVRIKNADLFIENGELAIQLAARVEPTAGIYIDYTVYAPYQASIQDGKDKQVVHFEMDQGNYREHHEVSAEWWVWLLAFLALILGAIVLAIILGVMDAVAPSIGVDTFTGAIKDVQWNYIKIAKLKTIELGNCIRIGCDAVFDTEAVR